MHEKQEQRVTTARTKRVIFEADVSVVLDDVSAVKSHSRDGASARLRAHAFDFNVRANLRDEHLCFRLLTRFFRNSL